MRRAFLTFSVAVALVALAVDPLLAQGKPSESGSPRGADRGSGPVASGAGRGGGGSSSGGSSSSGGGASAPSAPSGGGTVDGGSRTRSVPRSGAPERRAPVSITRLPSTPSDGGTRGPDAAGPAREVPEYGRPRGGRPATGTAVARSEAPFSRPDYWNGWFPGYRTTFPYGVWYPGYWGASYFYYDPFWWSDPYGYGYSGGYYGGGYGRSYYAYGDYGKLRLKVKPREAQVYVDGYFSGIVDQFDGVFQRLQLRAGGHRIEIRAEGYQPLAFEVMITPHETVTYTGTLKPN
jgi:hypothetical protein